MNKYINSLETVSLDAGDTLYMNLELHLKHSFKKRIVLNPELLKNFLESVVDRYFVFCELKEGGIYEEKNEKKS